MDKKRTPWLFATLSGLVILLIAWLILGVYGKRFTINTTTYFFLLVIAALSATAFLSGALKSTSQYEGNVYKGKLKLGGPIVVFVLILLIGYKFRPVSREAPFDLTIYAYGAGGKSDPVKEGIIRLQEGNETKSGLLDSNGRVVLNNINPSYLGQNVLITSSVENYHIASGDTEIQVPRKNNPVIFLPMIPNRDSLLVSGTVTKKNHALLTKAVLQFTEFSVSTTTDSLGGFSVYLPTKKGRNTGLIIRSGDAIVYNSNIILGGFLNISVDE